MTDENLLTFAKLSEQARGDLQGDANLLDHGGLPTDPEVSSSLTWLDQVTRASDELEARSLQETGAGQALLEDVVTTAASDAVREGDAITASHLVAITEQELDAATIEVTTRVNELIANNDATCFQLVAGNPNTGKTAWAFLTTDVRKLVHDRILDEDYVVMSNVASSSTTDVYVASMHELMLELLERPDTPKAILIDEGSTHFDSTTNRREVREQWNPAAKRFAKLDVDLCSTIGHTGKDVHPEYKRLTTLPVFKEAKEEAQLFERWPADADRPIDELDWSPLERVPDTRDAYDPDDAAPWSWNLEPELFSLDRSWSGLLEELRDRGPADD